MRTRFSQSLVLINLLSLALLLTVYLLPVPAIRVILGIPFLLFVPGYALVAALFAYRKGMGGIELVALSFGLSIAVMPLIGLMLNYTPWGIRLEPVLFAGTVFIMACSVVAWLRHRRAPDRGSAERWAWPAISLRGTGIRDQVFTVVMLLVVAAALFTAGSFIMSPKASETFTQFYILSQDGKEGVPSELASGERGAIILGITNNEGVAATYRVKVLSGGDQVAEVGPVALADKQEWQAEVGFVLNAAGPDQKVQFVLYRDGQNRPYLEPLYLWVNVTGATPETAVQEIPDAD
ncbi:MAG: DUF1616 domain-containing protein [Chloroflexi bacterium]|nr:DUF1616 domain-containing protein [Chloroflexota bacterium]